MKSRLQLFVVLATLGKLSDAFVPGSTTLKSAISSFTGDRNGHTSSTCNHRCCLKLHVGSVQQQQTQLIPEGNPHADHNAYSLGGTKYSDVLACLEHLYPPEQLHQRNAISRTDGYWPYIHKGGEPPQDNTYGEFDFYFFAELLDRAYSYFDSSSLTENGWKDKVFCDIGSGTGRLVLAAAGLHSNFKCCRGVELLPGISKVAQEKLNECKQQQTNGYSLNGMKGNDSIKLPMAPVDLVCGSIEDPYVDIADSDLIFVFSSAMGASLMQIIASSIGRQCKPGTIVITTDYMLPLEGTVLPVENDPDVPSGEYKLELADEVEGFCWLTGGPSTAFIHRVTQNCQQQDYNTNTASTMDAYQLAYMAMTK